MMKVPVTKTVSEEVEVELPLYGSWFDDVDDGRVSWETHFCIDEQLRMWTVTKWIGGDRKWELAVSQLKLWEVGHYLKHDRNDADEFWRRVDTARKLFER